MLPILILLVSQINPYGEAQAQIIVPSATGAIAGGGLGGGFVTGALQVDPAIVYDPAAARTRAGLDEDYRLAQLLIARTLQRRMEAMRLQAAAGEIEVNNARLREFICTRFCAPTAATIPATPMFPSQLREVPADPMYGVPPADTLTVPPYVPTVPISREDFNARYYIRHGGTVQVQVLPNAYRRY